MVPVLRNSSSSDAASINQDAGIASTMFLEKSIFSVIGIKKPQQLPGRSGGLVLTRISERIQESNQESSSMESACLVITNYCLRWEAFFFAVCALYLKSPKYTHEISKRKDGLIDLSITKKENDPPISLIVCLGGKIRELKWQWAGVEDFGYAMMGKVEEDASGAFVRAIRRPSGSVFVVQSSGPCFILLISFVGKLLCFKFFSI